MKVHYRLYVTSLILVVTLCLATMPALAQDNIHIVQPGENLYRISQRYGVSMQNIAQANNISNQSRIYAGQPLTIPDLSNAVETDLFAAEPTQHVVQPGETLASIASKYGLTVAQLAQINNIANVNRIFRGETLIVFTAPEAAPEETIADPAPVNEASAPGTGNLTHTVQPGEHLAQIAQTYGVSWPAIVQANGITDPNRIETGQTLIIPDAATVRDVGIVTPLIDNTGAPAPTITTGKQIIVDLSDSRVYAYEDGRLVRNVLSSNGLPATPTVQGSFTIERKYDAQLMTGPDYYLPNVQWVMYFYAGYAIHGTYWHNNFGQPMSHGCVNLPNDEALWFYQWAPIGTPVLVQA